jgi:hypothetical protein
MTDEQLTDIAWRREQRLDPLPREIVALLAEVKRLKADAWAVVYKEVVARFSPERPPTENERHLLNLLAWRDLENVRLRAEVLAMQQQMQAMAERIADQSELLSRAAERKQV